MKFRVIVADCPWSFDDRLQMSDVPRGAEANYPVLDFASLLRLDVASLAAEDAVLALWYPDSLNQEALTVMSHWGFAHKQTFHWVKTIKDGSRPAFGMGRMFRGCVEAALIGKRGRPEVRNRSQRNGEHTIIDADFATPQGHSVKPETLQDRLELMFEGPYLELFGRRDRLDWMVVGNQAPQTQGRDIRELVDAIKAMPQPA